MATILPGKPYPPGATCDSKGVNFAIFAERAEAVELCLFDTAEARRESVRVPLTNQTDQVWHCYIPDMQPGQLYAYRVYGAYEPRAGLRYNHYKLLVDPYAKALTRDVIWDDALFGYPVGSGEQADLLMDERDSAPFIPRCSVVDPSFDWRGDKPLEIPLHDSIIYELHVKGFSMLNPEVPDHLRGTYAGLAHPASVSYLKKLGITAVELMPVHQFVADRHLVERGLTNYWGYNTLAFFAPDVRYASNQDSGKQVLEFKHMVRTLHSAGIEVILDVVYNHTAEGNHLGPTFSMKGVDNPAYYRLVPGDERYYMDYTGTGNSLNTVHPRTLQLIMDSLRYWVEEMHVDGFRFDLAATLARGLYEGGQLSSFFDIINQDPVIARAKLIAEPWDVGPGGYQVGGFPVMWAEWNGRYRDTVRRFWKGDEAHIGEIAYRLAGSSDLYQSSGRSPYASVNFVTAHDGFTLRDLVSYNEKHNEANGEGNRDGDSHNNSWNCGIEGPTDDAQVNRLRVRQQRNLLATLLLSQGVPMLLMGDERNRSQGGNNNAYCQDNAISWLNWELDNDGQALLDFTRELIALRHRHPVLHRRTFFQGRAIHGAEVKDIEWYSPDGKIMNGEEWDSGMLRSLGMLLNGRLINERDPQGELICDDILLVLLNAHHERIAFTLPGAEGGPQWTLQFDTTSLNGTESRVLPVGAHYELQGRSLALLCQDGEEWAAHYGRAAAPVTVDPPPLIAGKAQDRERTVVGTLLKIAGFHSPELGNERDILVHLPPGYDEGTERYPVIYMHDGQNLFDEATSFAGEWQVDETLEALSKRGLAAIVVGIPHMGEQRIDEYSPFAVEGQSGGRGDAYLVFIIHTLKPYIDRAFRTHPEREQTGIVGSSMGGLISLYAMLRHPESFGFAGAFSPALWFADGAIFDVLKGVKEARGRIYLDIGLEEGEELVADARRMRTALARKGWKRGSLLKWVEQPGAAHEESAWAGRLGEALTFLLGGA